MMSLPLLRTFSRTPSFVIPLYARIFSPYPLLALIPLTQNLIQQLPSSHGHAAILNVVDRSSNKVSIVRTFPHVSIFRFSNP
jgi:hypothetical protein